MEMPMAPKTPYADSRLSAFLTKRILELRPRKSQLEIAAKAGARVAHVEEDAGA